ncbi:glycosyltransferase family 39 protein [Cellulomonas endophytica]|uniref:glycosyltransferase family 39 protein n=1 Tax=Cellulomonas endophytica TaxID=2494735 RepID=UPI0013E97D44|nr:glycosyltransferase family 39 protein [Cellulomonas endophytica]
MTAVGTVPLATVPTWELTVRSLLPRRVAGAVGRRVRHLPLGVVLLVQLIAAVRLDRSAFQDEALYIYTGHLIIGAWSGGPGPVVDPAAYFSGAPQLYPVLAGFLDGVGGLGLVRSFSTLCMLAATVAVYSASRDLLGARRGTTVATTAALAFALTPTVLHVSHFATYDAPSFMLVAWAYALCVRAQVRRRSQGWSVLAGLLAAAAVLLKYASAIDLPLLVVVALVAGVRRRRDLRPALQHAAATTLTASAVLVVSVLTWARPLLRGLTTTTTDREAMVTGHVPETVGTLLEVAGVTYALMGAGALLLARRRLLLALALLVAMCAAPGYQVAMGEEVSFTKHVVLGLVLGAPLAGLLIARLVEHRLGVLVALAVLWAGLLQGLFGSARLYDVWPETDDLASVLRYSVEAMPGIQILGDNPEPLEYALRDATEPAQWSATYEGSFFHEGLHGLDAYEAALTDNHFQLVFLDGSYPVSASLLPRMEAFGFERTGTVRTAYGAHEWEIFQRFDDLD